jgi:hypothetical protein
VPQTKYYLSDIQRNFLVNVESLSLVIPNDTDTTGWRLFDNSGNSLTISPSWAKASMGNIISPTAFVATPQPQSNSSLLGSLRTDSKLNGSIPAQTWLGNVALHGNIHDWNNATINAKLTVRLFKSTSSIGTGAIEIGTRLYYSNTFAVVNNGAVSVPISLALEQVLFIDEYLFMLIGLEVIDYSSITSAGSDFRLDVIIDFGSSSYLSIPAFMPIIRSEDVCRPFGHSEMYIYISPDGIQYPLDVDGRRAVLNDQGTGMPPIDYITQRGPFQHGETLLAAYAQPRVVQLMILQKYNNRDSWWNGRANLLRQFSPRKQLSDSAVQTGVLRRILSTGEKRDLNCLIQEGPKFNPRADAVWDELSYTEALRFVGFDPIYYDPAVWSYVFDTQGSQLTFPVIFPFTLSTIHQTVLLQYDGSWLCYPKFIITGPMTYVKIWNMTTDEVIEIIYDLTAGQSITIDLQYGSKTVELNDSTSLMTYVTHDSQIGTFHLTEVNDGVNQFHVHMVGVTGASQIEMQYNNRYLGL